MAKVENASRVLLNTLKTRLDASIGVETSKGMFTPILKRGLSIPCQKIEVFSTTADNQESIDIHVLQGNANTISDPTVITIGKVSLKGISHARAGIPQIQVCFSVNVVGEFQLSAKELTTGRNIEVSGLSDTTHPYTPQETPQEVCSHSPAETVLSDGKWVTIPILLLFAVIISVLIQIPLVLTDAVTIWLIDSTPPGPGFTPTWEITKWFGPIACGAVGFFYTGVLLGYLVSVATKHEHCRNSGTEKTVTVVTIGLSLIWRLLLVAIVLDFFGLAEKFGVQSILDMPALYWVKTLISFGMVTIGAFITVGKEKIKASPIKN